MDKWAKLHWRKRILNLAVRILNKLIPEREAFCPQTQMVSHLFDRLNRAYKQEVAAGRFDDVPWQTLGSLKDRHFQRLLQLSEKLLIYFGEEDRYYRQWLGFAMLIVQDEVKAELRGLSLEVFENLVLSQWQFDMSGAVPMEYFNAHKEDFLNMVLANFLMNLV